MNTKFPRSLLALLVAGLLLVGVPTAATATTRTDDLPGDYITEADVAELAVPDVPQTTRLGSKSEIPDQYIQCIVCGTVPVSHAAVVSGPVLVTQWWVKYLTSVWAMAQSYTWTSTTTATATLSTDVSLSAANVSTKLGLTASRSRTWSVGITVPASSTRYSKLSLLSDYDRRYIQTWITVDSKLSGSYKYAYLYTPTVNQYIKVTYK
jgi:hypothetical protein